MKTYNSEQKRLFSSYEKKTQLQVKLIEFENRKNQVPQVQVTPKDVPQISQIGSIFKGVLGFKPESVESIRSRFPITIKKKLIAIRRFSKQTKQDMTEHSINMWNLKTNSQPTTTK